MLSYTHNAAEPRPCQENLCPTCGQPLPQIKAFIDPVSGEFIAPECRIHLEPIEAEFMRVLLRRRAMRTDELWDALYGHLPNGGPDPKIVSVFLCKIRKKLRRTPYSIETLWGQGLRFRDTRQPIRHYE